MPSSSSLDISYTTGKIYTGLMNTTGSYGKYGVYYNYYAATAGTISGDNNQSEATQDICPKGWKMPSQDQFNNLASAYNNESAKIIEALRAPFAGYYVEGQSSDNGYIDSFWSTTTRLYNDRYTFGIWNDGFNTSSSDVRGRGHTMRCVLK